MSDQDSGAHQAFGGIIGKTIANSKPWWPRETQTPQAAAPNILVVLFDDVGFSDFGCYGSSIRTPTIDRLAAEACATAASTPRRCARRRARRC